jgi:type II secretory pathway predicted ATPase ExeA
MFLNYYNLLEQPFGVTPDTRFLYLNHMYREALASLWYGIEERRGFMSLVAYPGMGKTTLLFQLLQRLRRASARTVFLFQTCCNTHDLLRYLLLDLGFDPAGDVPSMHYQLNDALLQEARAGRPLILVIDEAQNLNESVLESVRLLSDFETSQGKLLQIILSGQPQLVNTLTKPNMLQFTQRLSVTAFLEPLNVQDVERYIQHRLGVAGYRGKGLFTPDALQFVAHESRGIPRNINNICFGALSTAFALGKKRIDFEIVREVAADQNFRSLGARMRSIPHREPAYGRPVSSAPPSKSVSWGKSFRRSILRAAQGTASLIVALLLTATATGAIVPPTPTFPHLQAVGIHSASRTPFLLQPRPLGDSSRVIKDGTNRAPSAVSCCVKGT